MLINDVELCFHRLILCRYVEFDCRKKSNERRSEKLSVLEFLFILFAWKCLLTKIQDLRDDVIHRATRASSEINSMLRMKNTQSKRKMKITNRKIFKNSPYEHDVCMCAHAQIFRHTSVYIFFHSIAREKKKIANYSFVSTMFECAYVYYSELDNKLNICDFSLESFSLFRVSLNRLSMHNMQSEQTRLSFTDASMKTI